MASSTSTDSENAERDRDAAHIRQRFEAAAELASDGLIIFDSADRVAFASQAAAELLGYSREKLAALTFGDLFWGENKGIFRDLVAKGRNLTGHRFNAKLKIMPSWGHELEVEAGLLIPSWESDVFISLRDISLSRLMEKETLKTNQFLRQIITNSGDGIIALDVSRNVLLFNQGAARMLGWTEKDVIGRMKLDDFLEPGRAEALWNRVHNEEWRDGPACILLPLEVTLISKTGKRIPAHLSASPIYEGDREVALVGIFTDLRSRVSMERALKETRDYLNNVMENAFDMIITTDLDSNIVSFNRGGERMLGYTRDEVIGRHVELFWPDPEQRRGLMRRLEHFDGAISNFETQLLHKNGALVDISLSLSLLTDNDGKTVGTVGISKDITDRKRVQAKLKETSDYLNAIVEDTPDIIITTNLDGQIVSFNSGAEIMLGYKREEVMGRHIESLYVEPEERRVLARTLEKRESSVSCETRLFAADGSEVAIDLTLSHLKNARDQIIGTVGVSKDITEKKRVEAELKQKKAELEEARLQIMHSEKMASLGKLATSIAHEINNPLGGILLFADMVLEEMSEEDINRPDVAQIKEQTLRCREIVKGLLEFGRMTGGRYSFIDLNRTVEQGLSLFANQVIFQNIEIIKKLDPDLPQIMGEASQLNQVFTNLIINAVDAMGGQGRLTIETSFDDEIEEVCVVFRDTGRGIPPEVMDRIFEPFFTTKPVGEGVGLGLSTSYGIVKMHGGKIDVVSELGKGSEFRVSLPMEALEQE